MRRVVEDHPLAVARQDQDMATVGFDRSFLSRTSSADPWRSAVR